MAVSPTGDELWVSRNDDIAVIRTSDNTLLTTIDIPSGHPGGIVFSPDGATVYVGGAAALTKINTAMRSIIANASLPSGWLAIAPDSNRLYSLGLQSLEVVNTADLSVARTFVSGPRSVPTSVAISPEGRKVYVSFSCKGKC